MVPRAATVFASEDRIDQTADTKKRRQLVGIDRLLGVPIVEGTDAVDHGPRLLPEGSGRGQQRDELAFERVDDLVLVGRPRSEDGERGHRAIDRLRLLRLAVPLRFGVQPMDDTAGGSS